MRRSKTASPTPESRGNFTPPPSAAAAADHSEHPVEGGGSRFALRNWRVATRLNAILLIPVLVALVFGGLTVSNSVKTLNDAEDAEKTAELVRAATAYGHALLDERDRTAAPLLDGDTAAAEVVESRKATDEAADAFHAAADRAPKTDNLKRRLNGFAREEPKLEKLRAGAYTKALDGVKTQVGYVEVQHPLMNLANELSLGSGNVTSYGRTVYAISLSKAAESLTRSIGTHLLVKPGPGKAAKEEQVTAFGSYAYLENVALSEFFAAGTQQDNNRLRGDFEALQKKAEEEVAKAKERAEAAGEDFVAPPDLKGMTERIATGASPSVLAEEGITPEVWYQAATAKFDAYRAVERDLTDRAVSEAGEIAADAKREAIINGAIVLAALLIAFLVAGFMARAMSRNMNRLRNAAFDVAEQRLPSLVDQLSRTEPGKVDTAVRPIPIDSRDEIGEVARAFDQVHREAVRLAAEQALLRGNVNAIFTNLSRRNQGLIERQLGLITDLENNEADPDQLENLFRLDHLATRMRRNGENLLVLAGEDSGRRWTQAVPLVDVMRAAASEVEAYERIDISGVPESDIHGQVVTDLVHLLAELLENATSFSSPQTKVKVTATRLPDGRVMIEIHDKGIGLTAEDFADINHKLADPPKVDAAISQRMGLYVVGRLADRHNIRVQLRPSGEQAGTTSLVMLPEAITRGGGGQEYVEEDFTVSRIVPEQAGDTAALPQLTADPANSATEPERQEGVYGGARVPDDLSALGAGSSPQQGQHGQHAEHGAAGQADAGNSVPAEGSWSQSRKTTGLDDDRDEYDAFAPPRRQSASYGDGYDHPGAGDALTDAHAQDAAYGDGYAGAGSYGEGYEGDAYYAQEQSRAADQPHAPDQYGHGPGVTIPGQAGPERDSGDTFDAFGRGRPAAPRGGAHLFQASPEQDPQSSGAYGAGGRGAQRADRGGPDPHPGPSHSEPVPGAPAPDQERVGFDRPGSSSGASHPLTSAGLPRRAKHGASAEETEAPQAQPEPAFAPEPQRESGVDASDWRSTNDERWERAESVRHPKAGGVTTSGLPRRVPRANLVEGTAEQTPQGGPQVSRSPEDVRGRLSNLHRGVRQGRAGTQGANQNDQPGFGTGSTYDQER